MVLPALTMYMPCARGRVTTGAASAVVRQRPSGEITVTVPVVRPVTTTLLPAVLMVTSEALQLSSTLLSEGTAERSLTWALPEPCWRR